MISSIYYYGNSINSYLLYLSLLGSLNVKFDSQKSQNINDLIFSIIVDAYN